MRSVLARVREAWDAPDRDAGRVPRALRERPPAGSLDASVVEHLREQVRAAFDGEFGGWGTGAKFPLPRTVEFALTRGGGDGRELARRTLEAVRTHLYDTYDGGFYRYAGARDWSDPHREKLTDENAALARAFASAYLHTGETAYRDTAVGTAEFLTTTLWTGEAFAGSQAGGDYFALEAGEREARDPPPVDATVFADRNGLAVEACLRVAALTDHEGARRAAARALEHVTGALVDGGRVAHYEGGPSGLLVDQTRVLGGLTAAAQVLGPGHVATARQVADWTLEALADGSGALRDRPDEDGPALLGRALYPLDPAVELADALVDLSVLAEETAYREAARGALAAFAGAADRMGVEVAGYGDVAARLLDDAGPLTVRVADDPGSDLHRAALRIADRGKVVVPCADGEPGTATVNGGRPAGTPAALEARVADARSRANGSA